MPYIDKRSRYEIMTGQRGPATEGELNFVLTTVVSDYIESAATAGDDHLRYRHVSAAVGALECAKLELYRRVAAPLEDAAIERNGDVYPASLVGGPEEHPNCGTPDCCGSCSTASFGPCPTPPQCSGDECAGGCCGA